MDSRHHSRFGTQNSAAEVMCAVTAELRHLRASYRELTRRIRVVRGVVHALRDLGSAAAAGNSYHDELTAPPRLNESLADRHVEEVLKQSEQSERTSVCSSNPELRRACRIALMETTAAVSDEEIYSRIVRRGSFSFIGVESAARAIYEELSALVEQGEIRMVGRYSKRLWQRIPPRHSPDPA